MGTPSCRMFSSEFRRACACISPVLLSLAKIISKSQSIRDIWALNLCDIDGDDDDYESATNDDDMIDMTVETNDAIAIAIASLRR